LRRDDATLRPPPPPREEPGRLRGHARRGGGPGPGARPAHRGGAARGRLRLGGHRAAQGLGRARMIRLATLAAAAALAGCSASLGSVGVLAPDADGLGLKLLRPGARGGPCLPSIAGLTVGAGRLGKGKPTALLRKRKGKATMTFWRSALVGIVVVGLGLPGAAAAAGKGNPMVLLSTSMGDIKVELYADKAPVSVKNFLDYV